MQMSAATPSPRRYRLSPNSILILSVGDITRWTGGAIVNAAIHRAAGPGLLKECRTIKEVMHGVRCPTGEARITRGHELPAEYVIHTVGPVYSSAAKSGPLLYSAYKSSLDLANKHNIKTIAFPALSTGVYGYPLDEAAKVSVRAVKENVGNVEEVSFVLFDTSNFSACQAAADDLLQRQCTEQQEGQPSINNQPQAEAQPCDLASRSTLPVEQTASEQSEPAAATGRAEQVGGTATAAQAAMSLGNAQPAELVPVEAGEEVQSTAAVAAEPSVAPLPTEPKKEL